MVNIGLLAYPLHGGRETRELGPKKCRTLGGAHPSLLQLTFPINSQMLGLTSQGPLLAGWASGRQWLVIHGLVG